MFRILGIILGGIITSFYFFPFEFTALPGVNTKMMLAALCAPIFLFKFIRDKSAYISRDFIIVSFLAMIVSLVGLISVTYNDTRDYAYATYIVSAWTWLGGAYTVCQYLTIIHGKNSLRILSNYLIAVCAFQCVIAEIMDQNHAVRDVVDSYVQQGQYLFQSIHRKYGIGAFLDVAGSKFAIVLIVVFYLLMNEKYEKKPKDYLFYTLSMVIIIGLGNTISRTTIVGVGIGVLYALYRSVTQKGKIQRNFLHTWVWLIGVLCLTIPLVVYLYNTDMDFHDDMRYGFEGFFSLVEKGKWEVSSNEQLKTMVVYPETLKTWVIGDGYFESPRHDPYYMGPIFSSGYYMRTDVGYLRFIFYFGVIGLAVFSLYFIVIARLCAKKFPKWQGLFVLLLMANFIIWLKVSTDMFFMFALFFCLPVNKEMFEEEQIENDVV